MTDTEDATAAAAKTAQAMADMAKTLAALTEELAKRPAVNALEHFVGLPANPLAFPPGANGAYPVLVTPVLHPHLLPDVIAQIRKFEFPPTLLGRLLKTHSVTPPAPLLLVLGPNGEAQFMPQTSVTGASALLREVPDVLTFVEAWMIFVSILQNEHLLLPVAQALTAYLNNVIAIARVYPWAAVLDYHVAFLQARAIDPFFNPIKWMKSDPHLHTMHLLTPSITLPTTPAAPAASSSDDRANPSPAVIAKMAGQICYYWNDSGCGGPGAGCYRRHICRLCRALSHTEKACPTRVTLTPVALPAP
ncbi:hypothetical protein B0H17DRAFT_1268699 [Mycena rosella]|uniref:C3H1-type domain-containing protein n=1 Tax=Mycena rosella TaxID=1033263 RepID=A0AAD7GLG6_MYCRO|nr:hypothetical protein B0H17DRAFT_1268699 [Mycena rosella]